MSIFATGRRSLAVRLTSGAAGGAAIATLLAGCGSGSHHVAAAVSPATTATTAAPPAPTTPVALVAPLTGLAQPSATQRNAPAVVVKVDNVVGALPQTGINKADVVYEEMVEGGLTRLAAIFQSQYPTSVGPVRSGRLTDIAIVDDLNHPVLAFAGANAIFLPQLRAQPIQDVDIANHGEMFVRSGPNVAPHNLYTSPPSDAALDTPSGPPPALFTYRPAGSALAGAGVASAASIALSWPATNVQWTFGAATHVYSRIQNGAPDADSAGTPVTATNIVVQAVPYTVSAQGYESGVLTAIPEGQLVGSGPVWVASDGKVVQGTWSRTSLSSVTAYTDSAGHPISLLPGNTWVELVNSATAPVIK